MARARAARPASSAAWRIRWFTALLTLLCLGLIAYDLQAPAAAHPTMPWWAVALCYYAAETAVVRLNLSSDSYAFSMTELAIALSLLLASPRSLLIGVVIAALVSTFAQRRQFSLKGFFNVVAFTVSAAAALAVFHAIPSHGTGDWRAWVAAITGAVAAAMTGATVVALAISLSDPAALTPRRMRLIVGLSGICAVANATVAVLAAVLIDARPLAAPMLAVPSIVLFLAYRAYLRERHKHESLEFLYESTVVLASTPQLDAAIVSLLGQVRSMFRAETATVVFATADGSLMSSSGATAKPTTAASAGLSGLSEPAGDDTGDDEPMLSPVTDPATLSLWEWLRSSGSPVLLRPGLTDPTGGFLERAGLRDAMVVPLAGEQRRLGMLVAANRLGGATSFDAEDLRLFATLANHASVALENGRLEQSLVQLREMERQLAHLAYHDPLTGLPNRSLFTRQVQEALTGPGAGECAVLFIDLDDFKTVNDTLGHAAGDRLLVTVAERIGGSLRPGDTPARLGGDEFAVLLQRLGAVADAEHVANRIHAALYHPVTLDGHEVTVRASIGIAAGGAAGTADELLRSADLAMYTAKAGGKNCVRIFHERFRAELARRYGLRADLERAVNEGAVVANYQPIVELASGRPVMLEALARWHHPEHGNVPPEIFIAAAEETGLINVVGRRIMREACRQAAEWQRQFPGAELRVSVNLSPRQVRSERLLDDVADAIADAGIEPGRLVLEITENLMLDDPAEGVAKLRQLGDLGVGIAVDDFGTGYSSLSYLRLLPIDMLKIAKPFVDDLGGGDDPSAFASAIVTLAHSLRLETVAEGVEHGWQAAQLHGLGCSLGQGYHYARPMTAAATMHYLRQRLAGGQPSNVIAFPA